MSKFQTLKSLFSIAENTSEGFKTICPFHQDKEPSLWVKDNGDDFPLGHCKAGCDNSQVGKFIFKKALDAGWTIGKREPEKVYQYYDENGEKTYKKLRFPKGTKPPFLIEPKGSVLTLYNLHKIKNAETVFIVEGEKDADNLESALSISSVAVTTTPNGAGEKFKSNYSEPLKNKEVFIIPDYDEAGLKHALKIKSALPQAKIILLPFLEFGNKQKKDISDFLQENSIEAFNKLLNSPASVEKLEKILIEHSKQTTPNTKKLTSDFIISDDFALSCHGLVGDITRWITRYSKYPQPALALGAALCCVGTIKAKKVCFGTNGLRTNLYILAFAPSAGGKGIAIKGISKIFTALNLDCQCGDLISDSGLVNDLAKKNGRGFIAWDEIGEALKHMTSDKSSLHFKKIAVELTKLFSSADSMYYGKQYANSDGKTPRKDIDQPCLNLFGATNITSFIDSLDSSQFSNGFLPRFIPIQVENERKRPLPDMIMPYPDDNLIEQCKAILGLDTRSENLLGEPVKVYSTEEAAIKLRKIELEYADRMISIENQNTINKSVSAILGRAYEHICKVALVLSDKEITLTDVNFAYSIISKCIEGMIDLAVEEAPKDDSARQMDELCDYIAQGGDGGMKQNRAMYRSTVPNVRGKKELEIILTTLEDQGRIIRHPSEPKTWIAV